MSGHLLCEGRQLDGVQISGCWTMRYLNITHSRSHDIKRSGCTGKYYLAATLYCCTSDTQNLYARHRHTSARYYTVSAMNAPRVSSQSSYDMYVLRVRAIYMPSHAASRAASRPRSDWDSELRRQADDMRGRCASHRLGSLSVHESQRTQVPSYQFITPRHLAEPQWHGIFAFSTGNL